MNARTHTLRPTLVIVTRPSCTVLLSLFRCLVFRSCPAPLGKGARGVSSNWGVGILLSYFLSHLPPLLSFLRLRFGRYTNEVQTSLEALWKMVAVWLMTSLPVFVSFRRVRRARCAPRRCSRFPFRPTGNRLPIEHRAVCTGSGSSFRLVCWDTSVFAVPRVHQRGKGIVLFS